MKLNPTAVVFWLMCAGIGWLIHGSVTGVVAWAVGAIAFSIAVQVVSE